MYPVAAAITTGILLVGRPRPAITVGRDPLISQKSHTKKVALLWILHVHSVVGSQMELVQGFICFRSHSLHLLMSMEVSEKFELQ